MSLSPTEPQLKAIADLVRTSHWEQARAYLEARLKERTLMALITSDAKVCGAAYELHLLLDFFDRAVSESRAPGLRPPALRDL